MSDKIIHGYSGACTPDSTGFYGQVQFSVGIFQLLPKTRKRKGVVEYKHGPVKVRVHGYTSDPTSVFNKAKEIIEQLDAGTYTGKKNVRAK